MPTLQSIRPSISTLSSEEAMSIHRAIRFHRRNAWVKKVRVTKPKLDSGQKAFMGLCEEDKMAILTELGITLEEL